MQNFSIIWVSRDKNQKITISGTITRNALFGAALALQANML